MYQIFWSSRCRTTRFGIVVESDGRYAESRRLFWADDAGQLSPGNVRRTRKRSADGFDVVHQGAVVVAITGRIRFRTGVDADELRPSLVSVVCGHEVAAVLGRPTVVAGHSGGYHDDGRPRSADADGARYVVIADRLPLRVLLSKRVGRLVFGTVDVGRLFDGLVEDAPFRVVRKTEVVGTAAVVCVPRSSGGAGVDEFRLCWTRGTTPTGIHSTATWRQQDSTLVFRPIIVF